MMLTRIALVAAVLSQACSPAPPLGARRPVDTSNKTVQVQQGVLERDWVFVEIDGYDGELPSPPPAAGFIMTSEGGRVTGTTACNRLGAGFQLDTNSGTLRFTSLRNTRMMCDRVAADTEEAVLSAMIATDGYRLSGNTLELLSNGRVVARLTSAD